jgi:hypothetical protein
MAVSFGDFFMQKNPGQLLWMCGLLSFDALIEKGFCERHI